MDAVRNKYLRQLVDVLTEETSHLKYHAPVVTYLRGVAARLCESEGLAEDVAQSIVEDTAADMIASARLYPISGLAPAAEQRAWVQTAVDYGFYGHAAGKARNA